MIIIENPSETYDPPSISLFNYRILNIFEIFDLYSSKVNQARQNEWI